MTGLDEVKYRIKFTKTGEAKWISHLDLARYLERSFRRAGLPIAYSNGFSPHPRISFGQALSVGVESQAEYVDVTFNFEQTIEEIQSRLLKAMSKAVKVLDVIKLGSESKKLGKVLRYADYQILIITENSNIELIKSRINSSTYLTSEGIKITSEERGNLSLEKINTADQDNGRLVVTVRTPVNLSPKNILKEVESLVAAEDVSIDITRIAQWSKSKERILDPIESK